MRLKIIALKPNAKRLWKCRKPTNTPSDDSLFDVADDTFAEKPIGEMIDDFSMPTFPSCKCAMVALQLNALNVKIG
jgi:hypothetical protein